MMITNEINRLQQKSRWVRRQILKMSTRAGEGRVGSAFSCTEILVSLFYGHILHFNIKDPEWDERNRFVVSKSPGAIGLYPILADLGFFPKGELEIFY